MTEQYLILHKVRGEPAFDVAINIGDEVNGDMWIIPTSGHRAYPYHYWKMDDLYDGSDMDMPQPTRVLEETELPPDLPEHYEVTAAKGKGKGNGQDLLTMLGLVKPVAPMTRRSW